MTDLLTPVEWLEQDYKRRADDWTTWPMYTRELFEIIDDDDESLYKVMEWQPGEDASHLGPEYPTALAPASA